VLKTVLPEVSMVWIQLIGLRVRQATDMLVHYVAYCGCTFQEVAGAVDDVIALVQEAVAQSDCCSSCTSWLGHIRHYI
jgi:hypothetical protein